MAPSSAAVVVPRAPSASSPSVRAVMQANASSATKPEVALRSALHRVGLRFRKNARIHASGCAVRPDVVFSKSRVAVFMDGCFWHGCPIHGTKPTTNAPYWIAKLELNQQRDARVSAALEESGWCVVRLWEHTPLDSAVRDVLTALADRRG